MKINENKKENKGKVNNENKQEKKEQRQIKPRLLKLSSFHQVKGSGIQVGIVMLLAFWFVKGQRLMVNDSGEPPPKDQWPTHQRKKIRKKGWSSIKSALNLFWFCLICFSL